MGSHRRPHLEPCLSGHFKLIPHTPYYGTADATPPPAPIRQELHPGLLLHGTAIFVVVFYGFAGKQT